jgi:hypothetical protein
LAQKRIKNRKKMNTENNKIIAEFMKYIKHTQTKSYLTKDGYFHDKDLKFHSDWNWLMEVVEKIESIKIETYKVRVDIYFNCCQINPTHWEQLISIYGNKETKIEAVYNACIEFIKWYNENKSHL